MAHLYILSKVRDYAAWKRVFDEFATQRRAAGEINYQIYHLDGDRNNFAMIQEWDSLDKAKAFVTSDALRGAMANAGVEGAPAFLFLNAGDSGKP